MHSDWRDILSVLGAPLVLAVCGGWMVYNSRSGPGTPLEWGRIALARAEGLIDGKEHDPATLREAVRCFRLGHKYLGIKHSGSDEWVRAILGETRATEELTKDSPHWPEETYRQAIEALKRAGRDASGLQAQLDKAVQGHRP